MQATVPIAPLAGYQGAVKRKPWNYRVTVALPHLDTLPQLQLALDLWRCQTIEPYFFVIDTGSPPELLPEVEKLRAPDCEVHYIRSHAYRHPSAAVTAALDLAQTLCQTEWLFHSHTDVFPRRRNLLEWLQQQCCHETPVVGWRMSPRPNSTSPHKEEWRESVSHTATMLFMPVCGPAGLVWSMESYFAQRPAERGHFAAWPDTESPFLLAMRRANIKPLLLGNELNFQRHGNEWWDHARSYTGLKASSREGDLHISLLYAQAKQYMASAEAEARSRLAQWRDSRNQGEG